MSCTYQGRACQLTLIRLTQVTRLSSCGNQELHDQEFTVSWLGELTHSALHANVTWCFYTWASPFQHFYKCSLQNKWRQIKTSFYFLFFQAQIYSERSHLWRKNRYREKFFLPQCGGKGSTYMFWQCRVVQMNTINSKRFCKIQIPMSLGSMVWEIRSSGVRKLNI